VTFGNPSAVDTTASFSAAGTYVLRLTASDSELSASDDVTVVVSPSGPTNQAPVVSAGVDQAVTLPASASLDGTVSDDGLPNPPGTVTTAWSVVSGPGTVSFGNAGSVDTTASFSAAGTYVLRLTASDSQLSASDDVTVTVSSASTGQLSVVKRGAIHSSTDATSYSFAPVTASNSRLYVVFLATSIDSGTAPLASSVSGAGLTFTEIGTAGGVLYSGTSGNRRIQAWRALVGSGATTGSIAIALSGASTGMDAVLLEFDGVDTSGSNGSGAVVQSASNGASSVTSLTVTLGAFAGGGNRPVAFFSHRVSEATTEEAGYTELDDASHGSPSAGAECEWNASAAETTPSASWASAAVAGGFAIEVRSAGAH
jgi:PKD repeat protein